MSNKAFDIEKSRSTQKPTAHVTNFEEKEADHISIESETNERVLKQPPDGGKAWLVLFGCFCVSCIKPLTFITKVKN